MFFVFFLHETLQPHYEVCSVKHAFSQPAGQPAGARLTYGRVSRFVSFLVGAHSPAVEKGVQGFLLPAPGQAAEALGARPGVNAARLPLGQGACEAAAAARLLDQLAADRDRRAHGQRLLVTRLARHV